MADIIHLGVQKIEENIYLPIPIGLYFSPHRIGPPWESGGHFSSSPVTFPIKPLPLPLDPDWHYCSALKVNFSQLLSQCPLCMLVLALSWEDDSRASFSTFHNYSWRLLMNRTGYIICERCGTAQPMCPRSQPYRAMVYFYKHPEDYQTSVLLIFIRFDSISFTLYHASHWPVCTQNNSTPFLCPITNHRGVFHTSGSVGFGWDLVNGGHC